MGSGLSMTSVNKIKELANSREYSLALEIVDSQDLSKSLNPQFLRLCGEIYIKNERFKDARRVLVMAHRLAPEAKRIIYSFVDLYLRIGYKELAKVYYELYLFDADERNEETKQIKYIYDKANGVDLNVLEEYIAPHYSQFMDYDWSFETCLLYKLQGNDMSAASLAEEYCATFKNSDNSSIIRSIVSDNGNVRQLFDVFSKVSVPDDDPEQEEIREEEKKLLEADDLRIHPKEAEITMILDDNDEPDAGSKRKLRKFLKEQEKEKEESENSDADVPEDSDNESKKSGLFQKVFGRKKKMQSEEDLVEAEVTVTDETESEVEEASQETEIAEEIKIETEAVVEAETPVTVEQETEAIAVEEAQHELEGQSDTSENDAYGQEITEEAMFESAEDFDMQEIHSKQHKSKYSSIVSIEADDDFAAESETIEDLKDDYDYSNPFESISALKKEKEEYRFVPKRKTDILFEDAEIAPEEPENEFEVDDFSSVGDDEFGEMQGTYTVDEADEFETEESDSEEFEITALETEEAEHKELEIEELEVEETEVEESETEEPEVEETEVEESEAEEAEVEEAEVEESEAEELEVEETEVEESETEEPEVEETEVEESEAEEAEVEEAEVEESEAEELEVEEAEVEESEVEESEAEELEVEEAEVEEFEAEELEIEEAEVEEFETEELEVEEAEVEESEAEELEIEGTVENSEAEEDEFVSTSEISKKNMDFPIFRTSLFPEYNQKVHEVENNFDTIMTAAQDKIQENILKEEQMQREAEELLTSLGINLNDINVTTTSYESIGEALYDGPSRDELKASLKIDSVKKDILKRLKEYR